MEGELTRGQTASEELARRQAADIAARVRLEAEEVARAGFACAGSAMADVLLVKGELSPAELAGGELLGGPDGVALRSALHALGYPDESWAALSTSVRPAGSSSWEPAAPDGLAWALEVVDPELVVALDVTAASALCAAFALDVTPEVGAVTVVRGRRLLCLGGFADALADPAAKRTMWTRLKRVPPLGSPL